MFGTKLVTNASTAHTIGAGTPKLTREIMTRAIDMLPMEAIAMHMHDTRGTALANILVGLELGIREFESSIAGLGGCPFAPGATGNICTEDLVYLLEESGYDTGVDLDALIEVAKRVEALIGRPLPGQVMKAGPRLRKYTLEGARRAVG